MIVKLFPEFFKSTKKITKDEDSGWTNYQKIAKDQFVLLYKKGITISIVSL